MMNRQPHEAPLEGTEQWLPVPLPPRLPTKDLYAQVRRRLLVLDTAEEAIIKERSELAMAWNRTLPVNRLPNELLVSIFTLVQLETAEKVYRARLRPDPLGPPYPSTKWMTLIRVCHYWRDVAYASPKLWRVILMRSPAYTERALALSSPATIDALFGHLKDYVANFQLLRPHAHRLRSLQFMVIDMVLKSYVIELLQGDGCVPTLETLQLPFFWRMAGLGDGDFADLQLTPERYPRLQSLIVKHIVAPQDLAVYARLRKLCLRSCRCDFSFDHFLDALNEATSLEVLVLDSFLEPIEGDWMRRPALTRSLLCMQQLQSLELLKDPPAYTSRFLSYLRLSPTVSARIYCEVEVPLEADFTETVAAILPSNPAVVLPGLALAKESDLISLAIESSLPEWGGFSPHGVRDPLSVSSSAPLTTLGFTGDCGDVPEATWAEVFSKYPLLETLRLAQADTTETVFAGLMDAVPPQDSPVPCPSLQSVSIEALFFDAATDVLLQCLRDRNEKGHRLKHVRLRLSGDEDEKALMDTEYIPELRELVTDAACTFKVLV
ncbi:hypothetical protein V8D89_000024 [Ganoderma adspersum]